MGYMSERRAWGRQHYALVDKIADQIVQAAGMSTTKAEEQKLASSRPDRRLIANPTHHGITKIKMYICPGKIFGRWHDKATRKIAKEQAREQHRMWGPCKRPNQPRTMRTISTIQEPKPGLRMMPWQSITPIWDR